MNRPGRADTPVVELLVDGGWRWAMAATVGLVAGTAIVLFDPLLAAALVALASLSLVLLTWRESVLAILVFVTWTRMSDALVASGRGVSLLEGLVALAAIVGVLRLIDGERAYALRRVAPVFLIAFCVLMLSLFYAQDTERTIDVLTEVAKGIAVAALIILLMDRVASLRAVVWSLIGAGALLSALTLFQQITGDFGTTFLGLAVPEQKQIVEGVEGIRAGGPVASTNYFAMILVAVVPLAIERAWRARTVAVRVLAGFAAIMITASILLTVSRGGILALGFVVAVLAVWRLRSVTFIVSLIVAAVAAGAFMSTDQLARFGTIATLVPGVSDKPTEHVIEDEFGGRVSEMLAAILMFRDHPVLGVGLGNYNTHYLDYSSELGLDSRREDRSAHSLYLEIAAETGALGIAAFALLLGLCGVSMEATRRRFEGGPHQEVADYIAALEIGMMGYLVASLLLHDAFPRYLWLLLGIGYAVPNMLAEGAAAEPRTAR